MLSAGRGCQLPPLLDGLVALLVLGCGSARGTEVRTLGLLVGPACSVSLPAVLLVGSV